MCALLTGPAYEYGSGSVLAAGGVPEKARAFVDRVLAAYDRYAAPPSGGYAL